MRNNECKGHPGWSHKDIHPKFQANFIHPSSSLFIETSTSLQKKKITRKQMEIVPQSLWLRFEASGASDPSSEGVEHALGISWIDDMVSHVDRGLITPMVMLRGFWIVGSDIRGLELLLHV